ncbi:DUF7565 family protein [Natrarchaeobaculum aegyptiacum]|uniref:C2H2-type domain-containing protein n=1 Tax=Natrarchaeobaculum aegyptiacum TaxID=745377 RepID=A0A2Z2HSP5_9EURY|nr:hypothetical protein [Natrarchaeobaculum aegyptiacum]ARS89115.1 hypothetical protein B1756_04640 [Natrarchaeobaculum aegyptiacum]
MAWECGIDDCGSVFGDVEDLVVHQATEHERRECKVCGTVVPDGYLAIRHAFTEHSRAEYVRAYDADAEDVRQREELLEEIESEADMERIATELKR